MVATTETIEHVKEVLNEVSKQCIDKSMSDSWFQLVEELVVLDLVKVKVVSFLSVQFD